MYISDTTARQRLTIANNVGDIFTCIERAHRILMEAWDRHFNRPCIDWLSGEDAQRINDTIYIATDILHDAITEFHMIIGSDSYDGVDPYISGAEQARRNIWIEKNRYKLPENGRDIMDLPSDMATEIIKALLSQKGEATDEV